MTMIYFPQHLPISILVPVSHSKLKTAMTSMNMVVLTAPPPTRPSLLLLSSCHVKLPILSCTRRQFLFRPLVSPVGSRTFLVSPPQAFAVSGDVVRDAGATVAVLAGGYGLVSVFDGLTYRNVISQGLSRKLVHILSGLMFMVSWSLFSTSTEARYFASLVPLTNCLRLLVNGLSLATDEGLIKSVTREGKPEELLQGPLFYVLVLAFCAAVFWRESPVGVISLAMMCGGDGVADIMGRKFGYVRIPYNLKKSWVGSISMFAFGFLISLGMLYYFSAMGYFQLDWHITIQRVALVSFIATVIESLPMTQLVDDNISVPIASMVAAYVCFCM